MIDPATISRIFDTAQVVEVVQEFVALKKRGVNYIGLCPFHNEKTPSFIVSPSKNIYKCFGCGKGGNPVNFVMDHEHMSYADALRWLARKYQIEIVEKEESPEALQERNDRESMMLLSQYAQKCFAENLLEHSEGREVGLSYFTERGFTEETIRRFGLGYALANRDAFTRAAQSDGYKMEYLEKTGLTIKGDHGLYDRFSGRVIFPIHDLTGRVVGFGGRILVTDKKSAKYLNSIESEIYHKSKTLYGIYQARQAIVQDDKCYLVEGYTDVLSLHQAGIANVVASSGTSLTTDQIRLVKRFTPNITVLYDGDAAGIKASIRGIDLLLEQGMNVKVLLLPDGEDPDSFARKQSSTVLRTYLRDNETDFISFKIKLLLDEAKADPIKRAALITEVVQSISLIPDGIIRAVYLKECSRLLQVEEQVLHTEVHNRRRKRSIQSTPVHAVRGGSDPANHLLDGAAPDRDSNASLSPDSAPAYSDNDQDRAEREILRLLVNYGSLELFGPTPEEPDASPLSVAAWLVKELTNDEIAFKNPFYAELFQLVCNQVWAGISPDTRFFVAHPNPAVSGMAADLVSSHYQLSRIWRNNEAYVQTEEMRLKELVPLSVAELKSKKVAVLLQEALQSMQHAGSEEQTYELLNRIASLTDVKCRLAENLGFRVIQ